MSDGFSEMLRGRADLVGVQLTDTQIAQLHTYWELLARWTRTINLTSLPLAGYPAKSVDRLLIEPLLAARVLALPPTHWIDLGSGGGSPAVPLRVIEPSGSLQLIESRERKTAFLREVVRILNLERTRVHATRIEQFAAASSSSPAVADLITMRAVRPTSAILRSAAQLLKPGGRFLVFGATRSSELADGRAEDTGLDQVESFPLLEPESRLYVLTRR